MVQPRGWLSKERSSVHSKPISSPVVPLLGRWLLAGLLAAPALAACQSTQPVGRIVLPKIIDTSDPELNPNPQHIVRLHGTAPESLDFKLAVVYASTNREGDCWNHAAFFDGGGEKRWRYVIEPVREGESWNADLTVDRYLPGRCGWKGGGTVLAYVVPEDAKPEESMSAAMGVVTWDYRDIDVSQPLCRQRERSCDEARRRVRRNDDEAVPVQFRCHRRAQDDIFKGNPTDFLCNFDYSGSDVKIAHMVTKKTKDVRVIFTYEGVRPSKADGDQE